jgi:protein-S-isoprenylcysteine O-methyltransferase Ste14
MSVRTQLKSTDWERVVVVPIIFFFLIWTIISLFSGSNIHSSSTPVTALLLCYRILLSAFYIMAIILLLIRTDAKARSERVAPRLAAYLGTLLPLLLAYVGGSEVSPGLEIFAVGLMTLGISFAVLSLITLGRSFGIEPQVRTLVRRGTYRFIRHPIYVGEMVALVGAVCFSPSLPRAGIVLAMVVIQTYRAVQEERLLEVNIPEYAEYKKARKRFVPGLF